MTEIPEYMDFKCPDCAAEVRFIVAEEFEPIAHDASCPQVALPLIDRTYTITVPAAA